MAIDKFIEFQKSEYEYIANAHFETIKQVSDFFRYYLLIVGAASILLIFFSTDTVISIKDIIQCHTEPYTSLMGIFFLTLSFVAFFVCWYIINLRHDAILYARTVNGIRKYFYQEEARFEPLKDESYRVLPKKVYQPKFLEKTLFFPVVFAIAIINSIYLGFGSFLILKIEELFWPFLLGVIFLLLHLILYYFLSYYRENYYMRTHKIGIDIDGVLNNHRVHFCKILKEVVNKEMDPNSITKIPVHEIESSTVTEIDEHRVFNTVKYWETMPPILASFDELEKIKNILGYKIYIFSRRDWPVWKKIPENEKAALKQQWTGKNIASITKEWLKNNGIKYDQLILENGNLDVSDTTFSIFKKTFWKMKGRRILTKNRFQISKRKNFRFFVDDDPIIVKKLADICDYVFIINHPYNMSEEFPLNVIRVNNWFEILTHVRRLS